MNFKILVDDLNGNYEYLDCPVDLSNIYINDENMTDQEIYRQNEVELDKYFARFAKDKNKAYLELGNPEKWPNPQELVKYDV